MKQSINLIDVENREERNILLLLKEREKVLYGNIPMEFKLSALRGSELILSLISKGYIRHVEKSSFLELNVELK
jgi:hypothetical protein